MAGHTGRAGDAVETDYPFIDDHQVYNFKMESRSDLFCRRAEGCGMG